MRELPGDFQSGPDNKRLIKNGKTIVSGIDPVRRAEKIIDSLFLKERTLYFCPSPVYGYGLSLLLSRIDADSAVLCAEADGEVFEISKANIDPSLFNDKKLHITNICESIKLIEIVRSVWGARAFRRVEIIRLTGGWQLSPDLYDSLCDNLRREIATDWSNALTLTKLGRLFIRNALRNLTILPQFPSLAELSYGQKPVLVLGAGPSLDETLDTLGRCFFNAENTASSANIVSSAKPHCSANSRLFKIICVDTCLGALKDRNIIPDLVVILESQHWNLRDFTGCRGWNVPAAADLSALPASVNILGNEGFLFMTPWTELKILNRLNEKKLLPAVIQPLGSVGLTAVEIARCLTKGNIICAGLDFSFTADMYHCRGAPGHRAKINTLNRFKGILNTAAYDTHSFAAVSKAGGSVFSSPVMRNYLNLFKREFGGDSRLFDIEGSGLFLGVKTLSLNEAMNMLMGNEESEIKNEKHLRDNKLVSSRGIYCNKNELIGFYECELKRLYELRDMLTGEGKAERERLLVLIGECDYLWAHFPDYAGGRVPDIADISFLNRLRAELDPMLKLVEQIIRACL